MFSIDPQHDNPKLLREIDQHREVLEFRKHKLVFEKQKAEEDVATLGKRIEDIIDQENKLSNYAERKRKINKPTGPKSKRKYTK